MRKKNVLFVDDEPNILEGLKRMLRSMKKDFHFGFAESGTEALEKMELERFDIIISDMRMPGMDGAQLLAEVQKRFPQVIRIMLSGQADEASVLRTIQVVHQFLAKPCDPDKLKEILVRSSELHDMFSNAELKALISGVDSLPSLPAIYLELQEKLKDPDSCIEDIGNIVAQDIGMTAKLLQLVNSAFFGLFQKVESPSRAVALLGIDTIKSLVLGLNIFSEAEAEAKSKVLSFAELWRHSMAVGAIARKIAVEEGCDREIVDNCFLAGILHDIGKVILATKMAEKYGMACDIAKNENLSLYEAENSIFGTTHSIMGAYLIGLWGFSTEIIEAIGFHHFIEHLKIREFTPTLAVHVADTLYHEMAGEMIIGKPPELNQIYLDSIGYGGKVDSWKSICLKSLV